MHLGRALPAVVETSSRSFGASSWPALILAWHILEAEALRKLGALVCDRARLEGRRSVRHCPVRGHLSRKRPLTDMSKL